MEHSTTSGGAAAKPEPEASATGPSAHGGEAPALELSRIPFFQKLSPGELGRLREIARRRSYPAGRTIFFEEDRSDALYVILSGSVKIYKTSSDGRDKIVNVMGKGDFFGEFALLDGWVRSASVATLEAAEMLSLSRLDFRAFASATPEILWKVVEWLCERLRRASDDKLDATFHDVPCRLLKVLVRLAEHQGEPADGGTRIRVKVSLSDLADMADAKVERVSRLIDRLLEEGVIVWPPGEHLRVPDMRVLRRAVDFASDRD